MRILLTGANGYLGGHLVHLLKQTDVDVVEVVRSSNTNKCTCDLTDKDEVAAMCKMVQPDLVIHCASFVPKLLSDYGSMELSSQNLEMLENIIDNTTCPIAYISSMTVYGEAENPLRSEKDAGNPQSAYGESKYEGELLLKRSGRDSLAVRIPGLFGGNRNSGLVANTLLSISKDLPLSLPDKPLIWAAMDVEDAAKSIIILSLSKFTGFNPVNVAYEGIYSINRFLQLSEDLFGEKLGYSVQHPAFEFDLSIAKSFGAVPMNDLMSALDKFIRTI